MNERALRLQSRLAAERLPLHLASASPRRHALLRALGFEFAVCPSDVDETPDAGLAPAEVARALALRKLGAAAPAVSRGIVIAADTIVTARGELLGKPADAADARRILGALSGTTHEVITGVALRRVPGGAQRVASATTSVTMRALAAREIDEYVASGEPFGKAGAYAIQERGDRFVTALAGEYDNVVGFPSALFLDLLEALLEAPVGSRAAR